MWLCRDWRRGRDYSALCASPLRGRPAGVIPASWLSQLTDPGPLEFMARLAEREGLTRAILALALRARFARPKSLQRFCRTPFSISRVRIPASLPRGQLIPTDENLPSVWRRGRDSNPRRAFDPYALSRGAPSTTRPPLRIMTIGPSRSAG